jgi:hypothetical protein
MVVYLVCYSARFFRLLQTLIFINEKLNVEDNTWSQVCNNYLSCIDGAAIKN